MTNDACSYGWNDAINLRRRLAEIMKHAPGLAKKVGITRKDMLEARRIEVKIHKIKGHIMSGKGVY